jgi:hypothetical protein
MPLYKFVGNKLLSTAQNLLLGTRLSEFHSGCRIYATTALEKLNFRLNSNDFHFDTEVIIQLINAGLRIKELSIPTYYGDEICRVNGVKYAKDVMVATVMNTLHRAGVMYRRRFEGPRPHLQIHSRWIREQLAKLNDQSADKKKQCGQFALRVEPGQARREYREGAKEECPRQIRDRFRVKRATGDLERIAQRNRGCRQEEGALPSVGARLFEPSFQEFRHSHLSLTLSFAAPAPCRAPL